MKDKVLIKSFQNGISLILNDSVEFQEIIDEITLKFSASKNFFGDASKAVALKGRTLTEKEEICIVDAIRDNSDVNVICIVGQDEETNRTYVKAIEDVKSKLTDGSEGQFYKGTLKNNQILETENSIVILGDIYPGSAVISSGNIIVLGGLYGEAYAGGNGRSDAYIVALEMEPEKLKIGDFKYKITSKRGKWSIHPKVQPKIAHVKNKRIVIDSLTKDLLSSFS